ncbi:MAG: hypothetical protein V2A54_03745 [Bacteroidota bacterium]
MKKIFFLLIVLAVVGTSCNTHERAIAKLKKNTDTSATAFTATYYSTSETSYEDITIENGVLTYVHLRKDFQCPPNYIAQVPCWKESDQVTDKVKLTQNEIDELKSVVEQAGFMKLNSVIGGAKDMQRFYPYTIKIKMGGMEREVTYQSFPNATPMPTAFEEVQKKLLAIAAAKKKL